jgi:D-cysteine desulfhydrase
LSIPLLDLLSRAPPRVQLGAFPSPVEHHPDLAAELGVSDLWVKRDDRNGPEFGGNKLRALEFLLPGSPRGLVTMGGYGSTWCAALARSGRAAGHDVHLALFPQPWATAVEGALSVTLQHGTVHHARRRWRIPLVVTRARSAARGPVQWLPAGGAHPAGVLGTVNAGIEFARQIRAGELPEPGAVVVPLGSGATAAGLLLGFRTQGLNTKVVAVRVTDPWFANRLMVMHVVRQTRRLLARYGLRVEPIPTSLRIVKDQLGGGYGHETPATILARQLAAERGLILESTYGAKAFAALRGLASSFPRLCFWHTFDTRLVSSPAVEHPFLREARLNSESLWPHRKSI